MYYSKSKVNLPVDVLQTTRCEVWPLYQELQSRHFSDKPMSGLVSVVFVYKPSLKMATPLSNCTVV